jgi:hypothetical protein
MHALRLLYECKEIVSSGRITLPRPERELLIRVRTGQFAREKIVDMANGLFSECEEAAKTSRLPEKVDRAAVSTLLAKVYRRAWDGRGEPTNA